MKLKIAAFLAAGLCIAQTFVHAQSIIGKVSDTAQKPLTGASVYLMQDTNLLKTAVADAAGGFLFDKLKAGTIYRINVSMVGFATYKSNMLKPDTLLTIALQPADKELQGVVITSRKQLVEQKIDRTVVNVDAMVGSAASTALDVLEKSPGVQVDQNGGISLKGNGGVKIYIDDKPTYLSGDDLASYLRSVSAGTIDQIELMTNPPAKYDAAGSGGIINIRLKRNKAKGFNGGINLGYTQGRYGKTNNSLNFTYRDNKFNLFGNFSYNAQEGFSDLDINRYFLNNDGSPASNFLQNSFIRRNIKSTNGRVGVDFYASDKTTLGIGVNGLLNPGDINTLNISHLSNAANVLDSTIVAQNREHRNFKNGGINFNYRHRYDKKGRELTVDADYLKYRFLTDQLFDNTGYLPNGNITTHDLLTGHLPSNISIYSFKTDYTHPLADGFKIDGGLKSSYTQTDNIANYFINTGGATLPDYGKTNHFIYKEQINAAYLNTGKDWKRVSIQAGLRFENTVSNGHQLGNVQKPDSAFKRNYNGLFPTFYIQYKLDTAGSHTISLDYGRRIERPYYEDLNPFLSPLDKFTYYTGNPFLKPSYSNNIELSHTWKTLTTTFYYSTTTDDVNETIEIVNGIYYSRPGNLGKTVHKGLSVNGSFDIAKWINFNVFARLSNIHTTSQFYTGTLNTQGTYYFIRPVFEFRLPKDWNLQTDGAYQSPVTNGQFIASKKWRINAAATKKISSALTLNLVLNDIFYSFVNAGKINNLANTRANYNNVGDSRSVAISLKYRFGKTITDLRKHNANGAEDEQNRVKN
jgi:outer membrane receptor protein involved in Fe transport